MENNGKGTGIFYGVIGVATLIITIIGATFAYFSATTNSAEGAVTAGGATITLAYSEDTEGIKENLIPIDPTLEGFDHNFVGKTANKCKDVNKNNICSVYQFTVENPDTNTVAQRIYGTIVPKTNTFKNFKFAIFKGTAADVDASDIGWDVDGTPVTAISTDWQKSNDPNIAYTASAEDASRKHVIANKGDLVFAAHHVEQASTAAITIPAFEQVLNVGESMTYTIVMWIDETGSAQNDDQGAAFAGGVNFTTEGNGTGVTGVLSATSSNQ